MFADTCYHRLRADPCDGRDVLSLSMSIISVPIGTSCWKSTVNIRMNGKTSGVSEARDNSDDDVRPAAPKADQSDVVAFRRQNLFIVHPA
jgi:hypothetical protein